RRSYKGCRFICSGAPHLAVRNQVAENGAPLFARARIVDGDGFSAGEFALRGCGWAWTLGFVLLGTNGNGGYDESENCKATDRKDLTHGYSLQRKNSNTEDTVYGREQMESGSSGRATYRHEIELAWLFSRV